MWNLRRHPAKHVACEWSKKKTKKKPQTWQCVKDLLFQACDPPAAYTARKKNNLEFYFTRNSRRVPRRSGIWMTAQRFGGRKAESEQAGAGQREDTH